MNSGMVDLVPRLRLQRYLYLLPLGAWVGCVIVDYAGAL